jgi:hypothetical protein
MIATSGDAAGARSRRAVPWLVLVAGLVLIGFVAGSGSGEGSDDDAFDPASTTPTGTRALVLLLEELDVDVTVTTETPSRDVDVWLILFDGMNDARHEEAMDWVRDGGVLVVADPYSPLSALVSSELSTGFGETTIDRSRCDIEALAPLQRVLTDLAYAYEVEPGRQSCFGDGTDAFVVASPEGDGVVVSIGSPWVFVNENLGDEDNAALATGLLAPSSETTVAILPPVYLGLEGEEIEERSLTDVMAPGARLAIIQLVVGFAAYAWYRARRLGQPVVEPQPVDIAGSELVVAVGNLLQQQRSPERAAQLLRSDLRRRLSERLGLGVQASPEVIADVASQRTGINRDRVLAAVADIPISTDAQLIELGRNIDEIRKEILHGS